VDPHFQFETRNVPCRTNVMGVKGAGEAGAIGSSPAVMNAILDALWRAHRVRHVDMPATPERVWQAIEEGRRGHTLSGGQRGFYGPPPGVGRAPPGRVPESWRS